MQNPKNIIAKVKATILKIKIGLIVAGALIIIAVISYILDIIPGLSGEGGDVPSTNTTEQKQYDGDGLNNSGDEGDEGPSKNDGEYSIDAGEKEKSKEIKDKEIISKEDIKDKKYNIELTDEQEEEMLNYLIECGYAKGNKKENSSKEDNKKYLLDKLTKKELAILYRVVNIKGFNLKDKRYDIEDLHTFALFAEAEIKATTIKMPNDGDINGGVVLYGQKEIDNYDSDNLVPMTYLPMDEFQAMVNNNGLESYKYFSINDSNELVLSNRSTEIKTYEYSEDYPEYLAREEDDSKTTYRTLTVAYKNCIAAFSVEWGFLESLLSLTRDNKFCNEVAKSIIENSYVNLVAINNRNTTEDIQKIDNKTEHIDCDFYITANWTYKKRNPDKDEEKNKIFNGSPAFTYTGIKNRSKIESKNYWSKETIVTKSYSPNVNVMEADSIFIKYKQTFEEKTRGSGSPESTREGTEEYNRLPAGKEVPVETSGNWNNFEGVNVISTIKSILQSSHRDKIIWGITITSCTEDRYLNKRVFDSTSKFSSGTITYKEELEDENAYEFKEDKDDLTGLVGLLNEFDQIVKDENGNKYVSGADVDENKKSNALENISRYQKQLYNLFERKTNHPELYTKTIKYILYILSNKKEDYGVTDINELIKLFSALNLSPTSSTSVVKYAFDFITAFEGSGPVEGDCYRAYDGGDGMVTIGHGVTNALIPGLKVGDLLPMEEVDQIQMELIRENLEYIKAQLPDATDYQLVAMLSFSYSGPKYRNEVVQHYKELWTPDQDKYFEGITEADIEILEKGTELRNKCFEARYRTNAGELRDAFKELFDNRLYDYWGQIVHVHNNAWAGLVRRRYEEFMMFQYAYNVGKGTFYSGGASAIQDKIVEIALDCLNHQNANSYGIVAHPGWCLAWVADVYAAAGAPVGGAGCANCAGSYFGVSTNWDEIPIGACVYGYSSSPAGHVGIYVGNDKVIHNIGSVAEHSLDAWISGWNGQCWGWESTEPILPEYPVHPGLMTGCGGKVGTCSRRR